MTDALGGTVAPPRYTAREVAAMFRVSTWFVQEQVRRGRISCLRVGDAPNAPMRFEAQHVEQLRRLMQPPPPPQRTRRRRRT